MKKPQSAFEIVSPSPRSISTPIPTPPTDTLRSQASMNSSLSRPRSPGGGGDYGYGYTKPQPPPVPTKPSKPSTSASIDRRVNGQQYKFNDMKPIDENEISVIFHSQSPDYGYSGDDSENLKLFPKRHPDWLISSNYDYHSPSSTLSRSPKHVQSINGDNKPLLINNGNISGTSGRNGAALNRISNANSNSGTRIGNGRRGDPTTSDRSKSLNGNGRPNFQRYQRRRRGGGIRVESLQVIAFICGCFASILLLMGLAASEWLIADGYRQGLFVYCVEKNTTNVPFVSGNTEQSTEGCHRIDLNFQKYTVWAAGFFLLSLFVDLFATLLTALGLRCRDPNKKYKYYRTAVYVMAVALVLVLVALVVYPVCFSQIMEKSQRRVWEFGWSYGVGWGASIFLFGGVILLLCDKESEEIYYKERTIVQYADSNNKV